jgi:hypothetical protein
MAETAVVIEMDEERDRKTCVPLDPSRLASAA